MSRARLYSSLAIAAVVLLVAAGSAWWLRRPRVSAEQRARIEHGRELYNLMCSVCHGEQGEGYRADRAPMLANPEFLGTVSDSFLRKAILDGRRGTTMSAWSKVRGGPLSQEDADAIIAHLRTWQQGPRPALVEKPPSGNASRAEPVFEKQCTKCHGTRGVGGPNIHIGNAELLVSASNGFLRHAIRRGRPGTEMPAFEGKLDGAAIEDVVALLRTWEHPEPPVIKPPPRQAPLPLGPVPLNPKGHDPVGFTPYPKPTSMEIVHAELVKGARMGFLDARTPSDYMREHIAGAVSVPFYDPSPYLAALPKNAWLVCYCSCPSAESGKLAEELMKHGFSKVTVLAEGIGPWRQKQYGVQSGDKP